MNNRTETITLQLPASTVYRLALEAHKDGVTLNDYVVRLACKRAEEVIDGAESETRPEAAAEVEGEEALPEGFIPVEVARADSA